MIHKNKLFSLLIGLCFVFSASVYSADFHSALVKDVSDRKYEPAIIELLDGAEESIVISMYVFKPLEKGPVRLLVGDLLEALDRGVRVEMYLNARFRAGYASDINTGEAFDLLREKGAKVYTTSSSVRLHDKLVIVDERYVVVGSTNWSVSALKSNFEATSLIDSETFAKEMLVRLRRLPLKGQESRKGKRPDRPKIDRTLPQESVITLSKTLLEDKSLFPYMVTHADNRAMNTYLLLLSYAKVWKEKEFFVSLEDLALDLRMPSKWSDSALRRQVIRVLKKLQNRYKLINVNFGYGKDAWVTIRELGSGHLNIGVNLSDIDPEVPQTRSSETSAGHLDIGLNAEEQPLTRSASDTLTFSERSYFFDPDFLSSKSTSVKYVLLIKALLKEEGTTIDSFMRKEISRRFHIHVRTLREALKEVRHLR